MQEPVSEKTNDHSLIQIVDQGQEPWNIGRKESHLSKIAKDMLREKRLAQRKNACPSLAKPPLRPEVMKISQIEPI